VGVEPRPERLERSRVGARGQLVEGGERLADQVRRQRRVPGEQEGDEVVARPGQPRLAERPGGMQGQRGDCAGDRQVRLGRGHRRAQDAAARAERPRHEPGLPRPVRVREDEDAGARQLRAQRPGGHPAGQRGGRPLGHRQGRHPGGHGPHRVGGRARELGLARGRRARQQLHERLAPGLDGRGAQGLLLREAGHGRRRHPVDVREDRLGDEVHGPGLDSAGLAQRGGPPPGHPRADAVGRLQGVQGAARAVLGASERLVGAEVLELGVVAEQVGELREGDGHALGDEPAELALQGLVVVRDLGADGGDDLVDHLVQAAAQEGADLLGHRGPRQRAAGGGGAGRRRAGRPGSGWRGVGGGHATQSRGCGAWAAVGLPVRARAGGERGGNHPWCRPRPRTPDAPQVLPARGGETTPMAGGAAELGRGRPVPPAKLGLAKRPRCSGFTPIATHGAA
jgi:hypothetical protein